MTVRLLAAIAPSLAVAACAGAEPTPRRAEAPARPAATSEPVPVAPRTVAIAIASESPTGLTADVIFATVQARRPDIDECYLVELRQRSRLAGKVVTEFVIAADGVTQNVEMQSTTLNNSRVESCVLRQVSQLVFPPPAGGSPVRVSFPFVFQPGGE